VVLAAVVGGATLLHGQSRLGLDSLLVATSHPPLPAEPSLYWFVPEGAGGRSTRGLDAAARRLAQGAQFIADGDFSAGLELISAPDLGDRNLSNYATYYRGIAQLGLGRYDEAITTLSLLATRPLEGALKELTTLQLAEAALARGTAERVEGALAQLTLDKLANPEDVWLMRARVEDAAGHRAHALEAYRRLYYDYPLSTQAASAPVAIGRLRSDDQLETFDRGLARAERFYSAKRYADAKAAFTALSPSDADGRELVALRIAESTYYMGQRRQAREALRPMLDSPSRAAEARYITALATKALGDRSGYIKQTRDLIEDFPASPWAEDALNGLATDYITNDDDDEADTVFRQLLRSFPRGRYTDRAAWKVGWRSYREGEFADAAEVFDGAAARSPRADNRPAWLYWSGRANDRLSNTVTANARYRLVVADYQNSYYGRLASKILASRGEPAVTARITAAPAPSVSAVVATDDIIRSLITAQMYPDALREVQYAQRVWGDSPQLQATSAWIRHQQGLTLSADERFAALRGAITTMRRAYPQFMAAGGETLPADVLRIIFPLDYWPLITKYSEQHKLDPYLIAALMAQESTFTAEIRSHANAYGLMQIIPDTGRRYARKMGIKPFNTAMLRQAETNVKIGTQYFRDLIDRYGGAHFALASYNAGESRVDRWTDERPGLPQDEFIDDIPFPETQTYVKRILGTAEDYRYLYGGGLLDPNLGPAIPTAVSAPKAATAAKATSTKKATPAKKPAAKKPARSRR
ncbi:MAG TPA: transglycosylase SLT domain-containing protein, partial [Vicinamibacterales bacterium]|nr:transglycosylase SLT domain-containing protein [Vicinamibacterales bacterium]